jgi:hypothetical protein
MGNNKNPTRQRILELSNADRNFLTDKVNDIIDRFQLCNTMAEDIKRELVMEFSRDLINNLILKINRTNFGEFNSNVHQL